MKSILIIISLLVFSSCRVYLTKGNKVQNVSYQELPQDVKNAYYDIYRRTEIQPDDIQQLVNLDSVKTNFDYLKNTSIEIIKTGNEVFKIEKKRFYLPWNLNKEIRPYLLHDKYFYCIVGNSKSWNNHSVLQLKQNRFLKIDLNKYLKY